MYLNYITCSFCCDTFFTDALVERANDNCNVFPVYPFGTKLPGDLLTGKRIGVLLWEQNKLTGCMIVKLWYSNFHSYTKHDAISYTNACQVLLKTLKEWFNKLFERRKPISLVRARFKDLIPGNYQVDLFDDKQEKIKLYRVIDSIKNRPGERWVGLKGGAKENSRRISCRNYKQKIIKL